MYKWIFTRFWRMAILLRAKDFAQTKDQLDELNQAIIEIEDNPNYSHELRRSMKERYREQSSLFCVRLAAFNKVLDILEKSDNLLVHK